MKLAVNLCVEGRCKGAGGWLHTRQLRPWEPHLSPSGVRYKYGGVRYKYGKGEPWNEPSGIGLELKLSV